ncbi:Pimeloyl-ACP methyl ester carboxylesterase [Amycolatopsis arida]|uniref:Pimeloyl-ACP methyl ester carboxylesterase n=1 Tax=Amycolatopsis arida TaxID=587909 RepID=A0A1I5ZSY9_9PSEU|nr:alpha/beta hydrolase [Amycolatopsis arida]TDX89345.1 pimeloyl-ACP methyl ester carboxylesterase [Amycolatopsis arida]SFQ59545.1 Pimeloyl-ACP methyl ester carboxylesterase [Amycolatopsis arida]
MPYLELPDGTPLYYEDQGVGRPVVLIHGWTMNGTFWADTAPPLAEHNRVITVDLRGHGRSGKTSAAHTLALYAADVRHLLRALDLDDACLVGWSMGTAVILTYVRDFGCERLRSVGFVDQSPCFLDRPGWDFPLLGGYSTTDLALFAQGLRHARPSVIKPFIEACFAEPPSADVVDAIYAETTQTPTDTALAIWMDMAHADLRPVLPDVTVPALLVYGERSKVFPGDLAGWLAGRLPDARVARFAGSGHAPFAEEPEEFTATLRGFLAE